MGERIEATTSAKRHSLGTAPRAISSALKARDIPAKGKERQATQPW